MASAKSGLNSPAISCGLKLNILFPANFCFVLWPCSFALSASTLFKVRIRSTETDVECWNEGINGHFQFDSGLHTQDYREYLWTSWSTDKRSLSAHDQLTSTVSSIPVKALSIPRATDS